MKRQWFYEILQCVCLSKNFRKLVKQRCVALGMAHEVKRGSIQNNLNHVFEPIRDIVFSSWRS